MKSEERQPQPLILSMSKITANQPGNASGSTALRGQAAAAFEQRPKEETDRKKRNRNFTASYTSSARFSTVGGSTPLHSPHPPVDLHHWPFTPSWPTRLTCGASNVGVLVSNSVHIFGHFQRLGPRRTAGCGIWHVPWTKSVQARRSTVPPRSQLKLAQLAAARACF